MATGGTVQAVIDIVYELHANQLAVACAMDPSYLGGSKKIKQQGINFYAAVQLTNITNTKQ